MSWVDQKTETEKLTQICIEICVVLASIGGQVAADVAPIQVKLASLASQQIVDRLTRKLKLSALEQAVKQINDIA